MKEIILLKYGELILKGTNRYIFEDLLIKNIKFAISGLGNVKIKSIQSTVYVDFEDDDCNLDLAMDKLSKVFGIAALTKACVCPLDFEQMQIMATTYLKEEIASAKSFRVIGKRADKSYYLTSPQIGVELGGYIFENFSHLSVDLKNPELTIYAEVREGHIFVHKNPIKGAGGLPCGSGGHGMLMLSGGIDSPVAGYMMARRGMKISAVHFESPPYTSERARMKVEKLTKLLSNYCGKISLFVVEFTEIQTLIRDNCRQDLFTIIMRRFMLRIACKIANLCKAKAILTGESLGQVASQTLEAITCTDEVSDIPVFRPLIGMDKLDITNISMKINTYETSIEPYEDCCTVFTPRHPDVHPKLEDVLKEEAKLNIENLIENVQFKRIDINI